ncbi:DUF3667 domain-containing protein [Flagellimonas nanhaiensis]|uniref:DUF3667 domain-containing protein n=1 Tax=Flagellimonas nanhaiensis TaxID=2292706 RepID=A0A371JLZ1_9FLAO|nr:DUF3667 domain-containing protein [Allomuricauda nanhaiensis]RDY58079.1 DUF3667 domain-containing protein [Allomuricauda nanhaiensis]
MGTKKGLITKGRYELKFRGTECLNCGHILTIDDKYCPNCGQANSTKKLILKDFFDEFFSSLINYDSKLLKTLYALLIKPGTITKDYVQGKRISYTNPFRFLLSLAFLYFLMFTYNSNLSNLDDMGLADRLKQNGPIFSFNNGETVSDTTNIQQQTEQVLGHLDSLENLERIPIPGIKKNLDSLQIAIDQGIQNEARKDSFMVANPRKYFENLQNGNSASLTERMEFFYTFLRRDSVSTFKDVQDKYGVRDSWKNRIAFNGSKSSLKAIAQPGTYLNNTIGKLPLVIFFFLPLFTVFIWMAYIRKRHTYTDHLIFSFHNQSLLFILLILSLILDTVLDITSAGIFITIFSVYLFLAMKRFYGQGTFKTIVKYLFLNTIFTILAVLAVILLFTGSIFTY